MCEASPGAEAIDAAHASDLGTAFQASCGTVEATEPNIPRLAGHGSNLTFDESVCDEHELLALIYTEAEATANNGAPPSDLVQEDKEGAGSSASEGSECAER